MKLVFASKLFLTLSLVSASFAQAATFETLEAMSDNLVESIAEAAQEAGSIHRGASEFSISRVGYSFSTSNTNSKNMIKQLIYQLRGVEKWSHPESLKLKKLPKTNAGITAFANGMLIHTEMSERGALIAKITDKVKEALDIASAFSIYTVEDSNSFGNCGSAVLLDEHEMEILLMSSCWSE
jgi:hypothetical protein